MKELNSPLSLIIMRDLDTGCRMHARQYVHVSTSDPIMQRNLGTNATVYALYMR